MIPRLSLLDWQEKIQWPSMEQIEQDLILSRIIVDIYNNPFLKEHLVFRGGMALNKLFISPAARYSEDVDLVQIKAGPIGPLIHELRNTLSPWLGKAKWKLSAGRATLYHKFTTESDGRQIRLKIEINTREHFHHFDLPEIAYNIENPWFTGNAQLKTYALEELMGTKLRALYQRKKGRDLFDLFTVLNTNPSLNCQHIIDCFHIYMKHENLYISKAEYQMNIAEKLEDEIFLKDITPFLRLGHVYDSIEAYTLMEEKLIHLLAGDPWKKRDKGMGLAL